MPDACLTPRSRDPIMQRPHIYISLTYTRILMLDSAPRRPVDLAVSSPPRILTLRPRTSHSADRSLPLITRALGRLSCEKDPYGRPMGASAASGVLLFQSLLVLGAYCRSSLGLGPSRVWGSLIPRVPSMRHLVISVSRAISRYLPHLPFNL